MSNGKQFTHSFVTAEDETGKKDGRTKTTHGVFDFTGVTDEDLIQIAIRQIVVKEQGRQRKNWADVKDGAKVTYKVKERMGRLAGSVKQIGVDDVKALLGADPKDLTEQQQKDRQMLLELLKDSMKS